MIRNLPRQIRAQHRDAEAAAQLPREIDEQSVVPMGQFLARYGAVEFARVEDTWGFLADGTGTYESVKGVVQIARGVKLCRSPLSVR